MKLLTLQELIDQKSFPTSTQLSAPLVIRVTDLLEWLLLQSLDGNIRINSGIVGTAQEGGE
jgi:hypothetical protein